MSSVQLATPAGAAPLPNVGVQAFAYGTYAAVGSVVKSGPVAYAVIGCTTSFGRTAKGSAAAVNAAPLGPSAPRPPPRPRRSRTVSR